MRNTLYILMLFIISSCSRLEESLKMSTLDENHIIEGNDTIVIEDVGYGLTQLKVKASGTLSDSSIIRLYDSYQCSHTDYVTDTIIGDFSHIFRGDWDGDEEAYVTIEAIDTTVTITGSVHFRGY